MKNEYAARAKAARRRVVEMIWRAKTSHVASNMSAIDIYTVLYAIADHAHDRIVHSKGWSAAAIYYFLAEYGFIPKEDLEKFPNAPYLGLTDLPVPGIYACGGSMGSGVPVSVGMALAKKRLRKPGRVFCVLSDGEWEEGTIWESALMAGQQKLDNLTFITDYNGWTAMGRTKDVADIEPAEDKWEAFRWYALRIDGHDSAAIEDALQYRSERPLMIIAETKKGKGVSFFENPPPHPGFPKSGHLYHYRTLDDETYEKALAELHD